MNEVSSTIIRITAFHIIVMALEIKTAITINATPKKVWEIFTNFREYPNWNPFIKSLEGEVIVGKKIRVRIKPPEVKGMTFKPTVETFIENSKFSWIGHLLFPGLFDGTHKFELSDNGNGTTTFIQSEKFKGILVPFFKKQLNNNTKNGFIAMNEKLKELSEK